LLEALVAKAAPPGLGAITAMHHHAADGEDVTAAEWRHARQVARHVTDTLAPLPADDGPPPAAEAVRAHCGGGALEATA
jgi:hypothetical protein